MLFATDFDEDLINVEGVTTATALASVWLPYLWLSPPALLIPWSWNASRLYLAVMMFMAVWVGRNGVKNNDWGTSDRILYMISVFTALFCLVLFTFVPLPNALYFKS